MEVESWCVTIVRMSSPVRGAVSKGNTMAAVHISALDINASTVLDIRPFRKPNVCAEADHAPSARVRMHNDSITADPAPYIQSVSLKFSYPAIVSKPGRTSIEGGLRASAHLWLADGPAPSGCPLLTDRRALPTGCYRACCSADRCAWQGA